MAKSKDSSISQESEIFNKGLIKDYDDIFYPEGTWSHARNATNFTVGGDQGIIGNEQGNKLCALAPYTIIGQIRITSDHFLIFSTNDLNSEIGIFTEGNCLYTKVVNDSCLNFKKSNLIIGTSKENFDCTFQVYWSDGVNPDRTLNIGDVRLGPFEQPWPGVPYICEDVNSDPDCVDCQPSTPYTLDCEEIRLARLISTPCIEIRKGASSGTLLNGSYYAVIAYSVNGQKVTEYYSPSIVQPLFSHANASGSLELTIRGLDSKTFDEFELVIVRTINQQTSAKRIGLYSTKGDVEIAIDYINESLPTIPIEQIPIRSQVIEKSEGIFVNGPYMLRTSPTGRFDFNYQPIANKIETEWVMIEAPIDYYRKGGNVTGYMRDEQYAFWIRFVYNTGDYSSSYHIPGRAKEVGREIDNHGTEYEILSPGSSNDVAHQASVFNNLTNLTTDPFWRSVNTAYVTSLDVNLQDTEQVIPFKTIATGKMGYWESTEKYPDTKPEVWNSSYHTWSNSGNPNHDLCGKPIRHHKMPGEILDYSPTNLQGTEGLGITRNPVLNASSYEIKNTARAIRILGVRFKNIYTPLDNDGNPIPGIVAYEILRSSRDGNRSIIAKGVVKNMRSYKNVDNETIYYQNYPYNFRGADKSLTKLPFYSGNPSQYTTGSDGAWNNPSNFLTDYSQSFLSFHSPDTQFKNPFLSANELHLYKQLGRYQNIKGTFAPVDGHPLEKLPTNLVFFISAVIGLGLAGKSVHGKHTRVLKSGRTSNLVGALPANPAPALAALDESALESRFPGFTRIFTEAVTGVNPAVTTYLIANAVGDAALLTPGVTGEGSTREITIEPSDQNYLPTLLRGAVGVVTYLNYFAEGAQSVFNILLNIMSYTQYAQAYTSHGYFHYSSKGNVDIATNSRRFIKDAGYIDNQLQSIGDKTINNLYRGRFVALDLIGNLNDPSGTDDSLKILSDRVTASSITDEGISRPFYSNSYMYYGALKLAFRNQYGQLTSVKQLTTRCRFPYKPLLNISNIYTVPVIAETSPVFGGDIYIGRYTEKNTFFYFYDWLSNQPDGTEFDYRLRTMVSNPRFWADFTKFDITSFLNTALNKAVDGNFGQMLEGLPTNMFNLDLDEQLTVSSYINASSEEDPGIFSGLLDFINSASDAIDGSAVNNMKSANRLRFLKKNAYFYLFQSGVIDLFVESEINIDLRDWGEDPSERHYDPYAYTNLRELFNIDHIKSGNYFKYDISLSVSKIFNNFISWGNMQPTYYNPSVAETCFTYYPNRVIYSLPQQDEAVKDYWRVFLPNNYKDFTSKPISVKQISKNGALLLFETQSPAQFLGVDTLQTDTGTKITIGDGGLFSQPLQYLTNADAEFQHGSCQNRLSVTNTPAGVYYLSQSQGKVFAVTGNGIEEISAAGMRWWFNKYLPYQLIKDFPDYYLTDNPVVGIGCQSVFDNTNQILYFSKRDFRRRRDFAGSFQYAPQYGYNKFLINNSIQVTLGDPDYFEDCSWTISYDPKNKMWISFHDWHPELTISSKNYFITTKTLQSQAGGIWKHNDNDYEFCRYYGISYPFEIEYIAATGQTVNTLKSLEYDLECYTYDIDGIDMYHVLDFNFDHAIVHNTEQVSGVLNLNLNPKGNPIAALQYPKINPTSIDIIFSKEEQKYRFNQFWDITRDRGEFTYPNVQQPIWNTELNGYKRDLNINNLDYQKASFERKKFRHYTTHVLLSRSVSGPVKMLFKITNVKNQYSPR